MEKLFHHTTSLKKIQDYIKIEKEKVNLDDCLPFILDNVMYNNIINYTSAKQI